ncbi:hypothetical protein KM043_013032 [Ampulex compressa]|nr:hypothetical protein KM043_013032 [Ampulex compressa]
MAALMVHLALTWLDRGESRYFRVCAHRGRWLWLEAGVLDIQETLIARRNKLLICLSSYISDSRCLSLTDYPISRQKFQGWFVLLGESDTYYEKLCSDVQQNCRRVNNIVVKIMGYDVCYNAVDILHAPVL